MFLMIYYLRVINYKTIDYRNHTTYLKFEGINSLIYYTHCKIIILQILKKFVLIIKRLRNTNNPILFKKQLFLFYIK